LVGIEGYSAYVPHYRISRADIAAQYGDEGGAGEVAVPAHDETVLSMATRTGRAALEHADVAGTEVGAVYTASTSDPFDERGCAAQVATTLGIGPDTGVADFHGSARASANAIQAAVDAVRAGRVDRVLVTASDIIRTDPGSTVERTGGAGAGSVLISADESVASLTGTSGRTTGFVGRFKRSGEGYTVSDDHFNREKGYLETIVPLLENHASAADAVAMPGPKNRWPGKALREANASVDRHTTFEDVGYAAAAGLLLDTVLVLETIEVGEEFVAIAYGPGGADAVRFEVGSVAAEPSASVTDHIQNKQTVPYMKHRRYRDWNRS
jgi:hydroxymethylglutaryl-CoA synthase